MTFLVADAASQVSQPHDVVALVLSLDVVAEPTAAHFVHYQAPLLKMARATDERPAVVRTIETDFCCNWGIGYGRQTDQSRDMSIVNDRYIETGVQYSSPP